MLNINSILKKIAVFSKTKSWKDDFNVFNNFLRESEKTTCWYYYENSVGLTDPPQI